MPAPHSDVEFFCPLNLPCSLLRKCASNFACTGPVQTAEQIPDLLGRGPHKNCKNDLDDQT